MYKKGKSETEIFSGNRHKLGTYAFSNGAIVVSWAKEEETHEVLAPIGAASLCSRDRERSDIADSGSAF